MTRLPALTHVTLFQAQRPTVSQQGQVGVDMCDGSALHQPAAQSISQSVRTGQDMTGQCTQVSCLITVCTLYLHVPR